MRDRAEIDRIVAACLGNAEELLNAAKCVAQTSSNHVGYHLATLALEEIGKAAMISMSSLREATDEERKGPIDWIDNHQRKLFWALWSIRFDKEVPGKSIQEAMDIAKSVHETRLATLYVYPNDPDARTRITNEQLQNLIRLTEAQLELQKMKKLREPTGELQIRP